MQGSDATKPGAKIEPGDDSELREDEVRRQLLAYVASRHPTVNGTPLNCDSQLLDLGIIDSLSMMSFILYLEQSYGLDFLTVDISRDDFVNVRSLARRVIMSLALGANSSERARPAGIASEPAVSGADKESAA